MELIQKFNYCSYICSAGEKETKSVISLFDDFMKSWVWGLHQLLNFWQNWILVCNYIFLKIIFAELRCLIHFPQHKRNPGLPKPRLFTVGRLDVATTGLIIVTNDGIDICPELCVDVWVNTFGLMNQIFYLMNFFMHLQVSLPIRFHILRLIYLRSKGLLSFSPFSCYMFSPTKNCIYTSACWFCSWI